MRVSRFLRSVQSVQRSGFTLTKGFRWINHEQYKKNYAKCHYVREGRFEGIISPCRISQQTPYKMYLVEDHTDLHYWFGFMTEEEAVQFLNHRNQGAGQIAFSQGIQTYEHHDRFPNAHVVLNIHLMPTNLQTAKQKEIKIRLLQNHSDIGYMAILRARVLDTFVSKELYDPVLASIDGAYNFYTSATMNNRNAATINKRRDS